MCDIDGSWVAWLEPAYLLWKPGGLNASDGFDIDSVPSSVYSTTILLFSILINSLTMSLILLRIYSRALLRKLLMTTMADMAQIKDPYDDMVKIFQTRVRHGKHITTNYVFCRPKPNQGVKYFGIKKVVKRDIEQVVKSHVPKDVVKKQKLEDEPLCATRS
ncbi:hypothetical protein ISN44_As01g052530 [Arabidopsis suecica]|uniref:Uncharacterized protein n=1 Tax=Arabidopsis suecica TaxID=45249 RepID=A0A8T2HHD9_ARASU|nr:hypothetical protein ISN44_As01g052530 [Arabidopsis suecica]